MSYGYDVVPFEQNWTKGTQVKDKNLQMLTESQNDGQPVFPRSLLAAVFEYIKQTPHCRGKNIGLPWLSTALLGGGGEGMVTGALDEHVSSYDKRAHGRVTAIDNKKNL